MLRFAVPAAPGECRRHKSHSKGKLPLPYPQLHSLIHAWRVGHRVESLEFRISGQGDLVSRFLSPVNHTVTPVMPIINLLIKKSPDPPNELCL